MIRKGRLNAVKAYWKRVARGAGMAGGCAAVVFCAVLALQSAPSARAAAPGTPDLVIRSHRGSFEDMRDRVVMAIEQRGLVVSATARVGVMLERTERDLGAAKSPYVHAEVVEFCSAILSRAMMEAEPHHVAYCPHSIAVYVLANERDRVYLTYRRFNMQNVSEATRIAGQNLEKLLDAIVREALE